MVASYVAALAGICLLVLAIALGIIGVRPPLWLPLTGSILTFVGLRGRYLFGQALGRMLHQQSAESLTTIYMPLLNEGTDVWRPVEAMKIGNLGYMVTENAPPDEEWAFQPGLILQCEERRLDGATELVAVAKAT